jgi:hypothetical protein
MPTRRLSARAIDSRSLHHRLTQLESRVGIDADPPEPVAVVFVEPNGEFGGRECHSDRAEELGGGRVWNREPHETQEQFKQRVMADAKCIRPNISTVIFWSVEHEAQ